MPTEKPQRSATAGSLLSQWWSLGALTREKRARTRHWRAAWIIFDRYMQRRGKGRASVRYISKATGMSQRAVVSACRELTEWGYTQRILGSGSRPSEYTPNWMTTPPFTVPSTDFEVVSGTHDDSTIATQEGHTKSLSGTHGGRESDLPLTGVKAELEVVSKSVTASGPGAVPAPAVAGKDFERVWRAYGRYGNKQASRKAFEAIENPDVDLIARRASAWAASAKPGQRRMPFEKWLEAEKYDEADRQVQPKPRVCKPEVRERSDADVAIANESARAERSLERKALDIGVPLNVPVTVVSETVESNDGDKWLRLETDEGSVGILLEANSCDLQQAGQKHFSQLTDACGLADVSEAIAFHGMSFIVTHDGIVPAQAAMQ